MSKGVKYVVTEGNSTFVGEQAIELTDTKLLKFIYSYKITSVTLIEKKEKKERKQS